MKMMRRYLFFLMKESQANVGKIRQRPSFSHLTDFNIIIKNYFCSFFFSWKNFRECLEICFIGWIWFLEKYRKQLFLNFEFIEFKLVKRAIENQWVRVSSNKGLSWKTPREANLIVLNCRPLIPLRKLTEHVAIHRPPWKRKIEKQCTDCCGLFERKTSRVYFFLLLKPLIGFAVYLFFSSVYMQCL